MEYWESTQRILQGEIPIVRRPKLTETLLKKPPFRFLHDVISEVCNQTGFAKGLYSPQELVSTNIKDKDSKMAYLWKIINCVGITLQTAVPVSPSKILAGLEPEQTNVFLQMLAAATMIDKKTSDMAVSLVLAGEKQPSDDQNGSQWIQLLKKTMAPRSLFFDASTLGTLEQSPSNITRSSTSPKDDKYCNVKMEETSRTLEQSSRIKPTPLDSSGSSVEQKDESSNIASNRPYRVAKSISISQSAIKSSRSHKSVEHKPSLQTTSKQHATKDSDRPNKQFQQASMVFSNQKSSTSSKEDSPTKSKSNRVVPAQSMGNDMNSQEEVTERLGMQSAPSSSVRVLSHVDEARPISMSYPAENQREVLMQCRGEQMDAYNPIQSSIALDSMINPDSTREEAATEQIQSKTPPRPSTSTRQSMLACTEARPQSARKAPPTLKNKTEKGENMDRPSSKASAREPQKKPSILLDNGKDDDDFEETSFCLPSTNVSREGRITTTCLDEGRKPVWDNVSDSKGDPESKENDSNNSSSIETEGQTGIILRGGRLSKSSITKGEHVKAITKEEEVE